MSNCTDCDKYNPTVYGRCPACADKRIAQLEAAYKAVIAAGDACPCERSLCYVNSGLVPEADEPGDCNAAECWLYHVQRGEDAG